MYSQIARSDNSNSGTQSISSLGSWLENKQVKAIVASGIYFSFSERVS